MSGSEGNMGSASMDADGGMSMSMSMDGGGMMMADGGGMMADGGGMSGMAHDMGNAAGTTAGNVANGAKEAGHAMADAGMAAAGAAKDSMGNAATTAADAAKTAGAGAKEGMQNAMDGGMSGSMSSGSGSASGSMSSASGSASGSMGKDSAPAMTDGQILAAAGAANKAEIGASTAVAKATKNAKVKAFANMMVKDHTAMNKEAMAMAKKAKLSPEEGEMSRMVQSGSDEAMAKMKELKGKDLDKAYVEQMTQDHEKVLKLIDDAMTATKSDTFKALLTKHRAKVQMHLEHAKTLQSSMAAQ